MGSRAEVVIAETTGHYWQTVAEVHRRIEVKGWAWSINVTRAVLNHLATVGILRREVRQGRVSTGVPGCHTERKVQMYRLVGQG
jgi:hypothetical protein